MLNTALLLAITTMAFSVIVLWVTIHNMLSGKSIKNFLPFFLLGIILSFYAGAIMFELFFSSIWVVLESMILLSLVWIFINIWRQSL